MVFFDEFAVSVRPNTSYSWACVNTRPEIPSIEGKRDRLNGMLAVSLLSGKQYLKCTKKAKSEDVAKYMIQLAKDSEEEGYERLIVILDNNSTHKKKMRTRVRNEILEKDQKLRISFMDTPPYSPNFNPAEYVIRMLRQKLLHHLPVGRGLEEIQERLDKGVKESIVTPRQIRNIWNHIEKLINL